MHPAQGHMRVGRGTLRRASLVSLLVAWLVLSAIALSRLSLFQEWRQPEEAAEAEPAAGPLDVDEPGAALAAAVKGGADTGHLHPKGRRRPEPLTAVQAEIRPPAGHPAALLPSNTAPAKPPRLRPRGQGSLLAQQGGTEEAPLPGAALKAAIQGTAEGSGGPPAKGDASALAHINADTPARTGAKAPAGSGIQAPASPKPSSPDTRTATDANGGAAWDPRVSGLGPKLDGSELHGGWQLTQGVWDRATKHPNATVLSDHGPRLVLVRGFLSSEEAEHMVALAEGDFARSEVVSDTASKQDVRTSEGSWLTGQKRDKKVLEVQHRIHLLLGVPEEFGESLHVLRYHPTQLYEAHTDHCAQQRGVPVTESCRLFLQRAGGPGCGPGAGGVTCGDRLATVIIYLRAPRQAGATVFPKARPRTLPALGQDTGVADKGDSLLGCEGGAKEGCPPDPPPGQFDHLIAFGGTDLGDRPWSRRRLRQQQQQQPGQAGVGEGGMAPAPAPGYCDERAGGLRVTPAAGDALLFWDYAPAGPMAAQQDPSTPLAVGPDPASLHGGCPVEDGVKYVMTRWVRSAKFN